MNVHQEKQRSSVTVLPQQRSWARAENLVTSQSPSLNRRKRKRKIYERESVRSVVVCISVSISHESIHSLNGAITATHTHIQTKRKLAAHSEIILITLWAVQTKGHSFFLSKNFKAKPRVFLVLQHNSIFREPSGRIFPIAQAEN